MAMVKGRRWQLAAAVCLVVLAACTSTAGRPGPGTGPAGTPAGSGPASPGGLRAVRHVWVIDLENQGYAQSFFGLPHLGDAAMPQVRSFSADIFG